MRQATANILVLLQEPLANQLLVQQFLSRPSQGSEHFVDCLTYLIIRLRHNLLIA